MSTASFPLPPGPRVALWQTLRYMRDPYAYTAEMRRRYGDVFSMPAMNGTLVIACTPDGAREILSGRESDFVMGFGVEAVEPLIGANSLLLLSGERHQRERKVLSPAFHGGRLRGYGPLVRECAEREVEGWSPGRSFPVLERMQSVSLDVIIHAVFGAQAPERVAAFREAVRLAVTEINPAVIFFKFLQRELGGRGPWSRFLERKRRLDALLFAQIQDARRRSSDARDVLHALVRMRHEDGSPLSDTAIRDHLLTLLVAGHETTATTLAWAFYEQARHPEIRARLLAEIEALGPDPDPDALVDLPYLDAFCRETLRRHPILAEFFRTVRTRFELQGWTIPAGVTLAGSILEIHRDPSLYPDPERFRPERFLERRFAPWEFAAFGGGHRHCLGAAFAMNELKVVLGTILPRVDLALAVDRPLRTVRRNVTLAPEEGVPVTVTRRLAGATPRAA